MKWFCWQLWNDRSSHPTTTSFQTSRQTSPTSKFLRTKDRLKSAELTKAEGRWTLGVGERGEGGVENRGMNELDSASGSLVAPQEVSVAIDLVSECSPPPTPILLPAARLTACICVLRSNRCQGAGSQWRVNLDLHWSVPLILILMMFHHLNL